jgi:hypothetical protein
LALLITAGIGLAACNTVVPPPVVTGPPASVPDGTPVASSSLAPSAFVPAEDPPLAIELLESGFTAFPDDGGGFASYGAVLRNSNTGWSVQRAEVMIDFLDATGAFIAGEEVAITILPGQTTAIAGQSSGAGNAARMEVHPPEDDPAFVPRPSTGEDFGVTGLRTEAVAGQWLTTGELESRFETPQSFVQLVAIYRDAAGHIVGGGGGGVQAIAPGASSAFEIVDSSPYADVSATDVYWQIAR